MANTPTKVQRAQRRSFIDYVRAESVRLSVLGRHGTARAYFTSASSLSSFLGRRDLRIDQVTPALIERYQAWLTQRGVVRNTVSYYMRSLRACYNRAVKSRLVSDARPFANVYTGVAKTRKRAIPETDLKRISRIPIQPGTKIEFVRDMFMLSFYMMGIPFVDLAHLRKTDIHGDIIEYYRQKTGQKITININDKIRSLLDKYPTHPRSPYLLPILHSGDDLRRQYTNALHCFNNNLKKIARLAGVGSNLTTYTARHSWASLAQKKHVQIGIISFALGHDSEHTTRIYLSTIDNGSVKHANDRITRNI